MANMAENLAIYCKAFRLFDPARIDTLGAMHNVAEVDVETQLKLIPFFDDNEVTALMAELPAYRALVIGEGVSWVATWIVRRGGQARRQRLVWVAGTRVPRWS
jgi:hypothetical protein